MTKSSSLPIYQEITLLALRDQKGTLAADFFEQTLAGALIAELVLRGHISITDDKKKFVELQNSELTGDPILDECLGKLANAKRRAKLGTWVSRFAGIKKLHHKAALQLCEKGILKVDQDKILLIFNRTIYPELDHRPEQAILARLEDAIFSDRADLEPHDAILLALVDASDLLTEHFDKKRLKPRRQRIKQITEGQLVAQATKDAIAAIQTAIIVSAVIVPAVVSTS